MTETKFPHVASRFVERLVELDAREVVQRYITSGACAHVTEEAAAEVRQRIAAKFEVHHTDVFIVGSAKLGFSIAPHKRWQLFSEDSDIDVAIVSTDLYLRIWRQVADLLMVDPTFSWERKRIFSGKHLAGWLRPDALPPSAALSLADDWFEFFRELTSLQVCGPYKINAGVYYDVHFLERYQERAVEMCNGSGDEE